VVKALEIHAATARPCGIDAEDGRAAVRREYCGPANAEDEWFGASKAVHELSEARFGVALAFKLLARIEGDAAWQWNPVEIEDFIVGPAKRSESRVLLADFIGDFDRRIVSRRAVVGDRRIGRCEYQDRPIGTLQMARLDPEDCGYCGALVGGQLWPFGRLAER